MKDEYDVIVSKTVRDLFKSTPLSQIDQYKKNKLKEIEAKDEELKQLILEKYSTLVNTITALGEISSNLKEFREIREKLGKNLSNLQFEEIEKELAKIKFDNDFIVKDSDEINQENITNISEEIDKFYVLLNDKKYDLLFEAITKVKSKVGEEKENYDFFLVELCEQIMKDFLNDSSANEHINLYKQYFDNLNESIIDDESRSKLCYSEFYLKVQNEETINKIFQKYFFNEDNFSVNILIKLLILKVSQNLILLSQCKDENFISEDNSKLIFQLYKVILSIFIIIKQFFGSYENLNEKISSLLEFLQKEITTNISALIVLSNNPEEKGIKCSELISFWNDILKQISQSNSKNEIEIQKFLVDNILEEKKELVCYLLGNKIIDQVVNVLSHYLKYFSEEHFQKIKLKSSNDNQIYLMLKRLNEFGSVEESYSIMKKQTIGAVSNKLKELLSKINTKINSQKYNNLFVNFIIKVFSLSEVEKLIESMNLNALTELLSKIYDVHIKNNFKQIENYITVSFKNFLKYENTSTEDLNVPSITDSLKELLIFFNTFEIKKKEYKIEIYNLVFQVYHEVVSQMKSKNLNPKILIDLSILSGIHFTEDTKDFTEVIQLVKQKLNVSNTFNPEKLDQVLGKMEVENFFLNDKYYENQNSFNPTQEIKFDLKFNSYRKEFLPVYNNKLNVYLINKIKINTSNSNQSSLYSNSTSKILEHRIDENYLSLRVNKTQTQNQSNMNTAHSNQNINIAGAFSQLSGKFFNLNK